MGTFKTGDLHQADVILSVKLGGPRPVHRWGARNRRKGSPRSSHHDRGNHLPLWGQPHSGPQPMPVSEPGQVIRGQSWAQSDMYLRAYSRV